MNKVTQNEGIYPDLCIFYRAVANPSKDEQHVINHILDRILEGKILQRDSLEIQRIIENMKIQHGITTIILGCTDLPVLHWHFPFHISDVLVFDSIRILAEAILMPEF